MGGVIALRNEHIAENEGCADIAHSQKLPAYEGESFVTLGGRAIVRLKPIARVESRWIAVDVSAIQFCSSRTVMLIAQNFDLGRDQLANAAWHVRFPRWCRGVVLRHTGVEKTLFAGLSPSLREAEIGRA